MLYWDIEVKNLRGKKPGGLSIFDTDPTHVYIGRPHSRLGLVGSVLHNPIKITKAVSRETAIMEYWKFMKSVLGTNPAYLNAKGIAIQDEFRRLVHLSLEYERLILWCWCSPRACHGHVLRELILARASSVHERRLEILKTEH